MRIDVLGDKTISTQARTYAEYRLFAALSQIVDTNRVKHARLVLQRTKPSGACESVFCSVGVEIEDGTSVRIHVFADHPYAAVNRAVERLTDRRWRPSAEDYSPVARAVAE